MKVSATLCRVLKTTGGKLWHKPWGVPSQTRASKQNAKAALAVVSANREALAAAASGEPALKAVGGPQQGVAGSVSSP